MIQRIQSVYWLASVVLLSAVCFLPLFTLEKRNFLTTDCKALTVTVIIAIALSAMNIFFYKNRKLQMRIGYGLLFLHFLMYFFIGAHFHLDGGMKFLPWVVMPAASLILQFMAIRSVKKDEALIKSMDRLR